MTDLTAENEVDISARALRTSLSETERLLAKFSEALRRRLVSNVQQGKIAPQESIETVTVVIDALTKMQGDFTVFKSRMDIILAFLSK